MKKWKKSKHIKKKWKKSKKTPKNPRYYGRKGVKKRYLQEFTTKKPQKVEKGRKWPKNRIHPKSPKSDKKDGDLSMGLS